MAVKTPSGFNAAGRFWQGRDGSGRRIFCPGAVPEGAEPGDTDVGTPGIPTDPGNFGIQSVLFPEGFAEGKPFVITGDVFGANGPTLIAAFQPTAPAFSVGDVLNNSTVINGTHWRNGTTKTLVADVAPFDGRLAFVQSGDNVDFYMDADDSVRAALGIGNDARWHGAVPFREYKVFNVIRDPDYFPNYDWNQLVVPQPGSDANGYSYSPSSTKDTWCMYGNRGDNQGTEGEGHDMIACAHSGGLAYRLGGNNSPYNSLPKLDGKASSLESHWGFAEHNHISFAVRLPGYDSLNQYNSACYGGALIAEVVHSSASIGTTVVDLAGNSFMKEVIHTGGTTKVPDWWDRMKYMAWLRSERDRRYSYLYCAVGHPVLGTKAMCSVEITNGAFGSANKRMLCPITSWSNTRIEGILWLGGLKEGQEPIYMCVANENNIRCSNFQVR